MNHELFMNDCRQIHIIVLYCCRYNFALNVAKVLRFWVIRKSVIRINER